MTGRYIVKGLHIRLRQAVADSNMTMTDIARKSGIRREALWGYLNNYRTPTLYPLMRLSKALNVSADWLLGLKEDRI